MRQHHIATRRSRRFTTTASGCRDSDNEHWNLDLDLVDELVIVAHASIIPFHLYGHPVDMARLAEIASATTSWCRDCAGSHGSRRCGPMTGSLGTWAASFLPTRSSPPRCGNVTPTTNRLAERLAASQSGFRQPASCTARRFNFRMTAYQGLVSRAIGAHRHFIEPTAHRQPYNGLLAGVPACRRRPSSTGPPRVLDLLVNLIGPSTPYPTSSWGRP